MLWMTRQTSPQTLVLVGHACHPTSMGTMNQWSPDYPGAMRRKLEAELPDSRAVFLQGCGGDAKVVRRDPATGAYAFSANPAENHAAGHDLAEAVLRDLRDADRRADARQAADSDVRRRAATAFVALQPTLKTTLVTGSLPFQPAASIAELRQLAQVGDLRSYQTWWARKMLAFPDPRQMLRYDVQA